MTMPVWFYGSDIWTITQRRTERMGTAEMKLLNIRSSYFIKP